MYYFEHRINLLLILAASPRPTRDKKFDSRSDFETGAFCFGEMPPRHVRVRTRPSPSPSPTYLLARTYSTFERENEDLFLHRTNRNNDHLLSATAAAPAFIFNERKKFGLDPKPLSTFIHTTQDNRWTKVFLNYIELYRI